MLQISKATEYNWKKLGSSTEHKLTGRANKTKSAKRIVAKSYVSNNEANKLLQIIGDLNKPVESIMYSLVVSLLKSKQILYKAHVRDFLNGYRDIEYVELPVPAYFWDSEGDILGFVYQSILTEGERNVSGKYYTHSKVVEYMIADLRLAKDETFLDPCCGSGAFLLEVQTDNPANLYGFDIDPIAVMLASANLLAKYCDKAFAPRIFCLDYLDNNLFADTALYIPDKFDYIYTNPPWGADKIGKYTNNYPLIKSKERASMFIVEALKHLKKSGSLYFLLPTSLLKIKTHSDVRKHLLSSAVIHRIDLYNNRFDGVFTDFFSIKLGAGHIDEQNYPVTNGESQSKVKIRKIEYPAANIITERMNSMDESITGKMESSCHDKLTHSQWALGIVTGDNKNKVKKDFESGLEAVYTGKQVGPFSLQEASSFILFEPKNFQQCAKTEFFRATEKLIYKFIAKYPIVAYDDKQCLCLNSANILIPELDSISIKSVAALLNSSLYRYYYTLKFPDIKVLKGNLQALPFPKLTPRQNKELSEMVTTFQVSGFSEEQQRQLDKAVYTIFHITSSEQAYIHTRSK